VLIAQAIFFLERGQTDVTESYYPRLCTSGVRK